MCQDKESENHVTTKWIHRNHIVHPSSKGLSETQLELSQIVNLELYIKGNCNAEGCLQRSFSHPQPGLTNEGIGIGERARMLMDTSPEATCSDVYQPNSSEVLISVNGQHPLTSSRRSTTNITLSTGDDKRIVDGYLSFHKKNEDLPYSFLESSSTTITSNIKMSKNHIFASTSPMLLSKGTLFKESSYFFQRLGITEAKESKGQSTMLQCVRNAVKKLIYFKVQDEPGKYFYDNSKIPSLPVPVVWMSLLYITELPFLILWMYATYWMVIVVMTFPHTSRTIWLSAAAAGLLVGIGLNANAYKCVTLCHQRYIMASNPYFTGSLEQDGIHAVKIDWGTVIRFFIIPFGVASLSGLTHAAEKDFLLVFPKNTTNLCIAFLCPTILVTVLIILRILLLRHLRIRWSSHVLFFNGTLVP